MRYKAKKTNEEKLKLYLKKLEHGRRKDQRTNSKRS